MLIGLNIQKNSGFNIKNYIEGKLYRSTLFHSKEKLDDNELRKILSKKPKKELIELLTDISNRYPHLKINFVASNLQQSILVSRIWQLFLLMKAEYSKEYAELIRRIVEKEQIQNRKKIKKSKTSKSVQLGNYKTLPFIADDICKHLHELIKNDHKLMSLWNSERKFYGFISLLGRNNMSIPVELIKIFYANIFGNKEKNELEKSLLINYSRYHLDLWEKDFKAVLTKLSTEELDLILSLHLLYDWIVELLIEQGERIIFKYEDIPLIKRVILAQYLKLLEGNECSDDELDRIAEKLKKIINVKVKRFNMEILPWGDLE